MTVDHRTNVRLWQLTLLLLAWFAVAQLSLGFARSPSADDAMFLSVPKNWLNGYGWATSYSDKIPFNPDFTGPTALLWLTTPLIQWFGTQLWIAGMTGALANLLLLGLCLQQMHRYWQHSGLAALALLGGCLASMPEDFASLIGYYSGSLLFLLACLVAFNPHYSLIRRAVLTGLLAGISLQVKLLLAPAFVILVLLLLLQGVRRYNTPYQLLQMCAGILLPVVVIVGGWQLYRQQVLAAYSEPFLAAHASYGHAFFLYHGSGIGQWLDAADRWQHLLRNVDRNLYFLEEMLALHGIRNPMLGSEPADVHHIFGWLFVGLTLVISGCTVRRALSITATWQAWLPAALSLTILAYVSWFLLLAMAMSPGHLYFPTQWTLWLLLLSPALLLPEAVSARVSLLLAAMVLVVSTGMMPAESRRTLLLFDREAIVKPDAMLQAGQYLASHQFTRPLAGCGYSGYPRHLEYLLPASQNFADCLDLIEDHVQLTADGRYEWKQPLAFNIVFSLQTPGINSATGMVLNACKDRVLYRNPEFIMMECRFADLQGIDLAKLMHELQLHQRWYRTRLMPYEGRYFPVLKP